MTASRSIVEEKEDSVWRSNKAFDSSLSFRCPLPLRHDYATSVYVGIVQSWTLWYSCPTSVLHFCSPFFDKELMHNEDTVAMLTRKLVTRLESQMQNKSTHVSL